MKKSRFYRMSSTMYKSFKYEINSQGKITKVHTDEEILDIINSNFGLIPCDGFIVS